MTNLICLMLLLAATGGTPLGGYAEAMDAYVSRKMESYTDEDVRLLAEAMYHENYSNGEYVMKLTGSVVLNRVNSRDYPDTVRGVLYQKGQYATTGKFFTERVPDCVYSYARELLVFGSVAPPHVVFQSMNPRLGRVWKVINGEYFAY